MVLGIKDLFKQSNSFSVEEEDYSRGPTVSSTKCEEDRRWPECLAAVSVMLFMVPAGISLGFSSVLIPQLEATESDLKITNVESSYIASSVALATPVGDVVTGFLINRVGRLTILRLGVVPYMLGWTCIALANNVPLMIVGRVLTGLFTAMAGGCGSAYVPEIVHPVLRGSLGSLALVFFSLGYLLVYVLGAFVGWRVVAWVAVPLCLPPLGLLTFLASESPLWLASRGRDQDAFKSLAFLTRANKQQEKVKRDFENEIKMLRQFQNDKGRSTLLGILTALKNQHKPVIISIVLLILHEFSGTYILVFYTVSIFKDLGTSMDPYLCTVGNGILGVLLGASCSLLMKYFGRRCLLLVSSVGMALSMFLAGFIKMEIDNGTMAPNIGPVICLLIYTVFNGIGMLTIPWSLPSEFLPVEMRGLAGMLFASSHLLMFAAIETFPFMPELLGGIHRVLWLFAGVSLAAAIFVYVFLPETHNKTVRATQEYFQNNTVYICRKKTIST